MLNICLALLPVLLLLCGLLLMDSFKLLRPSSLAVALAWGAAVALVSQPLHEWLLDDVGVDLHDADALRRAGRRRGAEGGASSSCCWRASGSAS